MSISIYPQDRTSKSLEPNLLISKSFIRQDSLLSVRPCSQLFLPLRTPSSISLSFKSERNETDLLTQTCTSQVSLFRGQHSLSWSLPFISHSITKPFRFSDSFQIYLSLSKVSFRLILVSDLLSVPQISPVAFLLVLIRVRCCQICSSHLQMEMLYCFRPMLKSFCGTSLVMDKNSYF